MDFNALLDTIARLFVVIGVPAGALWAVWTKRILPARQRREQARQAHEFEASADTLEYEHGREIKAFSHTVLINESLVTFQIKIIENEFAAVNERLDSHEKVFYTIQQHIARGAAAIENSNRAAVSAAEREDDIEQLLHTILELLRTSLSRNGTLKTE